MNLARYRDVFGRPGEGAHAWRVCGLAGTDVVLSLLMAWAIANRAGTSVGRTTAAVFVSGIALHRLFRVNTALDVTLFGPR